MLLENDVKGRWHYTFWNTTLAVLTFALIQSYTTICRSFYSLSGADYQFCNVFYDLDITMKNHERHRHVTMVDCYITECDAFIVECGSVILFLSSSGTCSESRTRCKWLCSFVWRQKSRLPALYFTKRNVIYHSHSFKVTWLFYRKGKRKFQHHNLGSLMTVMQIWYKCRAVISSFSFMHGFEGIIVIYQGKHQQPNRMDTSIRWLTLLRQKKEVWQWKNRCSDQMPLNNRFIKTQQYLKNPIIVNKRWYSRLQICILTRREHFVISWKIIPKQATFHLYHW